MKYEKLTVQELRDGIVSQKFTSVEVLKYFIKRCEKCKNLNAIIEIFADSIEKARMVDEKIARGERVGKLAGVPIAIKDNIFYKDHKLSCASMFLQDFVAPYNATVVEKLLAEDAIIFARTNMDEFAMGGSTEKSCYGPCHNAVNLDYVSGGSSGGSAVAVAAGLAPVALGTDTGGSIRQPASFNGIVGIKPTYGAVSRYGVVAFASSLDQVSPFAKTIDECKYVFDIIAGKDPHDQTTITINAKKTAKKRYKIGVCKQIIQNYERMKGGRIFKETLRRLENIFDFISIDLEHVENALACYYIIAPAEAASNLARFDAVKYATLDDSAKTLEEVYVKSRSKGFGKEVKRRIMLGNFVLSSGYYDAYYGKAKKLQSLIRQEFNNAFEKCDAIMLPTTPYTAFKIGEKSTSPVAMYLEDLFTVPANIAGIPAISIPYAIADDNGLPLGMQFMAKQKNDQILFEISKVFASSLEVK